MLICQVHFSLYSTTRFTDDQREDAITSLGINRIVDMPPDYKDIWSDIPPDINKINNYLEPVKIWLNHEARDEDYVFNSGRFRGLLHYNKLLFPF